MNTQSDPDRSQLMALIFTILLLVNVVYFLFSIFV